MGDVAKSGYQRWGGRNYTGSDITFSGLTSQLFGWLSLAIIRHFKYQEIEPSKKPLKVGTMTRQNMLFENLDLENGFKPIKGKVDGIDEKVLIDDMDHTAKTGKRTRLLRLKAGVQTPETHDHPYWEELYVLKGSMIEGSPTTGENHIIAPAYGCRQPGFMHGPIRTEEDCYLIEFNWYDEAPIS
jgi:hypothetical protein